MYLPGRFRRRQGPAGLAPGLDGERCGVHGAAAGSARARTHARRPRAVGDRRRQGAAQSARRCPRRRRSHSTLPTAQGAQPRRPRAESPPDVRPGGPAAGLSSGQRGRGAPATDGARDVAGAKRPDRCRRQCARRPRGNAHGTEAGAAADAPPLLRDDELYRESDRHAPARHAEHQTLARWRHAPAVDRARPAARRGAFPVHQAPWRARRARDGPRHRHVRGARRVSPRGHRRRKRAATIGSGSIFSPGAAMSVIPRAAVNGRYDGLPPHSAKFNSERDNPCVARQRGKPRMLVIAAGILGFAGIVLLAALLLVGIEAGSELVRDLKRDPGLKIALWAIAAVAGLYVLERLAEFVYWLLGS